MNKIINNNEVIVEMFPLGESGILVEFGKKIHPDINQKVKVLTDYLDRNPFLGMIECVTAFSSVAVYYDPLIVKKSQSQLKRENEISFKIVESLIKKILLTLNYSDYNKGSVVEIPVCYGGEFGPDLEYVAKYSNLSIEKVIKIHSNKEYLVYMIGFAPGFPYLGGMSEKIATPRRESPRTCIPKGSVGIAGMQTGVYPQSTPGGWQLIGSTPMEIFNPDKCPISLLKSGDMVKFYPISSEEYKEYKEKSKCI